MALGGGTYTVQNKVLPGSYINFFSAAAASASISDRGIATIPLMLDWGKDDEVFTVTNEDFQKRSQKIFGYAYTDGQMKGLRDLFIGTKTLHAYRLNSGGDKAANDYAVAVCSGIRGNDLKIAIQGNLDEADAWDVITYLGADKVDTQTVKSVKELNANDFVSFKDDFVLAAVAGASLSGGTNGTATNAAYQAYLDKIESYRYNTMGVVTADDTVKSLFAAFNKRLRDEVGIKFQLVLYNYTKPDYMGVISVKNKCLDGAAKGEDGAMVYPDEAAAVYWTVGAQAGCAVNASVQNRVYSGEFDIDVNYTQAELAAAIKAGEFVFHKADDEVRVLEDINTMVTTTDTMGDVFKDNQTIRVIDELANSDALLFNKKYMGVVPNDDAGRSSLWKDLCKIRKKLQKIRAIENFNEMDVQVAQGDTKKAVVVSDAITVVNAMSKMYMTTTIS
ncbi:MAG: phage tail sheath family protein [Ruminococcus flavefaciens]|nr:phage tail sheath family protein [Ruminococcus flavefaciens]